NELAAIIEKFFPLPSLLASSYSTAPLELVDLIVSYLYDEPRSAQGNTPLMIFLEIAEHYGYSEEKISFVVKALLNHGANPSASSKFGTTPLHIAAAHALPNVVDILLRYKDQIDINAQNNLGETPLHTSVRIAGTKEFLYSQKAHLIIPKLINTGANPNIPIKSGATPLHTAILMHQDQIVATLLTAPTIDISIQNALGKTPLDYAHESLSYLRDHQGIYTQADWKLLQHTEMACLAKIISLLEAHQTPPTN
ncbi:MAG: ankyrin repeat domain-containing protein, partial [Candidatus Babeliales bacterium]